MAQRPFPIAELLTHPETDERDIDELWQLIQTCRHIRRTVSEDTLWTASRPRSIDANELPYHNRNPTDNDQSKELSCQ